MKKSITREDQDHKNLKKKAHPSPKSQEHCKTSEIESRETSEEEEECKEGPHDWNDYFQQEN